MPVRGYGGASTYGITDVIVASSIGVAPGRICSDGATGPIRIVEHTIQMGGEGASRTVRFYIGTVNSAPFVVPAGTAPRTIGTDVFIANGGTFEMGINPVGAQLMRFLRGGGGDTHDGDGFVWAGQMSGAYAYWQCPAAPTISSVTSNADGTSATIVHANPSDTGDIGLTGTRIQRATNSSFTSGLVTVSATGTSTVMTGLTPGVTYYYRATARNNVTDTAGVLGGPWSSTVSKTQEDPAGLGRRYNGSSFQDNAGKRFSGSSWVDLAGKRRNAGNTAWVDLGP